MLTGPSAEHIHQTLETEHSDLMPVYYDDWKYFRKGRPGAVYFTYPIFRHTKGSEVSCFFLPGTIREAETLAGFQMTVQQKKALEHFECIAERYNTHYSYKLGSGEMIILNNKKVLHARDSYSDNESDDRRILFRVWVDLNG